MTPQAQTLVNQVNQRQPGYLKSIGIPPEYELAWGKQTLEARRLNELIARNPANEARIVDASKGIAVSVNPRFGHVERGPPRRRPGPNRSVVATQGRRRAHARLRLGG